jgi:predicted metalloprotease with PDZ domain
LTRSPAAAGGLVLAGLLAGTALAEQPRLDVRVEVGELAASSVAIRLELSGLTTDDLVLRPLPLYVDNPVAEAAGEVVRDLRVRVDGRERVPGSWTDRSKETGWWIGSVVDRVRIEYAVDVDFRAGPMATDYPIQIPYMDARRAWLTGNHVFLIPTDSADLVSNLIEPLPVHVQFDLPAGTGLFGPPREFALNDRMELASLQFGLGDFEELRGEGDRGEWSVYLPAREDFSSAETRRLADRMREMVELVADLFGGVPFGRTGLLVFRHDGMGGLEGAWSGQAYLPRDLDLSDDSDPRVGTFFTVACHELFHAWIPVSLFPRDDPWFKEGVTSYYGHVLASRAGWIAPEEVDELFSRYRRRVFGDPKLQAVELGDPRLWYEEYSGEDWRLVTYERGHAVALLLDVYLRTETEGRASLDDVLGVLFDDHAGGSFGRADLLAALRSATGVDASEFFAKWVDTTGVPSPEAVDAALRRAVELGVYGPR